MGCWESGSAWSDQGGKGTLVEELTSLYMLGLEEEERTTQARPRTESLTDSLPSPPDEDVYCELVKHGNLLEMHVCDNVGDHLIGSVPPPSSSSPRALTHPHRNVYARYEWEEQAATAVEALNHRWYAGMSLSLLSARNAS